MSFTIGKRFTFSAAHQLDGLPAEHPCSRLHGHNYVVWLELQANDLNADGMVMDFGDLESFRRHVDTTLDHQHLNEAIPDMHPTAENLAAYLHGIAASLLPVWAVTVWETPTCWARYEP